MSEVRDTPATGVLDDVDLYLGIYRRMLVIRGFEDLVQSLFLAGEVYGTTHLYSGQEAIATGVPAFKPPEAKNAAAIPMRMNPQTTVATRTVRADGLSVVMLDMCLSYFAAWLTVRSPLMTQTST